MRAVAPKGPPMVRHIQISSLLYHRAKYVEGLLVQLLLGCFTPLAESLSMGSSTGTGLFGDLSASSGGAVLSTSVRHCASMCVYPWVTPLSISPITSNHRKSCMEFSDADALFLHMHMEHFFCQEGTILCKVSFPIWGPLELWIIMTLGRNLKGTRTEASEASERSQQSGMVDIVVQDLLSIHGNQVL